MESMALNLYHDGRINLGKYGHLVDPWSIIWLATEGGSRRGDSVDM